jgi:hypothetical protein
MLVSLFVLIYVDYLLFLYLPSSSFLLFSSGNDRVGWQEKMEELKFFFNVSFLFFFITLIPERKTKLNFAQLIFCFS